MEYTDNKTDRFFRDRLENLEQSPPDTSWEHITRKMEDRKKKRAALLFLRIAAGMALVISTGIGIYFISTSSNNSELLTQSTEEANDQITVQQNNNADNPAEPQQDRNNQAKSANPVSAEVNNQPVQQPDKRPIERNIANNLAEKDEMIDRSLNSGQSELAEVNSSEAESAEIKNNETAITEIVSSGNENKTIVSNAADTLLTPEQAAAILLAQNDPAPQVLPQKKRNWTIGSEIAPLYSDRNISSQSYSNQVGSLNSSETGILAYAGGIRVGLNAGKRVTIQSGVYYSRYGQQINEVQAISGVGESDESYKFIAASNSTGDIEGVISTKSNDAFIAFNQLAFYDADNRNGITNSELKPLVQADATDIQLKQIFDYFELPLIVKYKVIDRKVDFSFSGGLITNFLVGNSVNLITDGDSRAIGQTAGINEINYLGSIGMGLEMPVSGKFSLSLEPRFRYYISPIDRSENISVHPYSFGFFAGVNYRF